VYVLVAKVPVHSAGVCVSCQGACA
jgi:hypothetical protein